MPDLACPNAEAPSAPPATVVEFETADHRVALFLTAGRGLGEWEAHGSLSRETRLYRQFADNGWRLSFYTYDQARKIPAPGFPCKIVPQWPYRLPSRLAWLYESLLPLLRYPRGADRPDLIMTNQAHGGWPAILAGWLWSAKVVARCGTVLGEREQVRGHDSIGVRRRKLVERWTFRHADCCVVPTAELAQWIIRHYGIDPSAVHVIPHYVDVARFRPLPVEPRFDIISVGRLVEKKRHQVLIEALQGTNLSLCIVGQGDWEPRLKRLAAEKGVRLEIIPRVENERLPELLNAARMFVILTTWETISKAQIEAMACGLPCIGARSPGIEQTIRHEETGLLVSAEIPEVRCAVLGLMADAGRRARLGKAGRAFVQTQFGFDVVFAQYRRLFRELLDG